MVEIMKENFKLIRSILIVLLLALILGSGAVGFKAVALFSEFNQTWDVYSREAKEKQLSLYVIREHIGYGGFIHHFKNYILRQEPRYIDLFTSSGNTLLNALQNYQSFSLNSDELTALKQLTLVVVEYKNKLPLAIQAQNEGWSPLKTDRLVIVNDQPAIDALEVLEQNWSKQYLQDMQEFNDTLQSGQFIAKFGFFIAIILSFVILLSIWFIQRLTLEIATRKKLESRLYMSDAVIKNITNGVSVADEKGKLIFINAAFEKITGYSSEEAIGKNSSILASGRHDKSFYQAIWKTILTKGSWEGEIWNRRKNGEIYPEWLAIHQLSKALSSVGRYIAIFSDITERKQKEDYITHLAKHDSLTQLPNRNLFIDRIESAILGCHRQKEGIALLFLDLDGFKPINDGLGHLIGDKILIEVAQRIKSSVRETDSICRYGGDEFLVLLSGINNDGDWNRIAEVLLSSINSSYFIDGNEINVGVSIGVAVYSSNAKKIKAEVLIHMADKAMYTAKNEGKNKISVIQ